MKYCGASQTQGHGEVFVCGESFYNGIHQCATCALAEYKEDAERYRWLRSLGGWPDTEAAMSGVFDDEFDRRIDELRGSRVWPA